MHERKEREKIEPNRSKYGWEIEREVCYTSSLILQTSITSYKRMS